jgi:hypothetical protein
MATRKQRVSLSFHILSPDLFDTFAVGIRDGIYGNPTEFATPPITQISLQALIDDYINKRAAYKQGGKAQKGPYLAARTALMAALDLLAGYVNELADGNADLIWLSGYAPTKANSSVVPVPGIPQLRELARGATRELFAECKPVNYADYYGCILIQGMPLPPFIGLNGNGQLEAIAIESDIPDEYKPVNGSIVAAFDLTKSRRKHFVGLLKGIDYYFYFYAVNATGVSPLSEPGVIMCG